MTSRTIVSEIENREAFFNLLRHNTGLILIKLGATWCGPCKKIEHVVHAFFASSPVDVICCDIDVDKTFDFYSFLKSKKWLMEYLLYYVIKKETQHLFQMKLLLVLILMDYTHFLRDVVNI